MRKIVTFLVCVSFLAPAGAQIRMGIKGSPQLTWVTSDSKAIGTGSTKVDISYGLVLDYFISDNYSFGTELSIGTMEGVLKPDTLFVKDAAGVGAGTRNLEYDYKLQYINLPFIIKMRTKEIGYMRYYAEFGLGMSYRFKAKGDITSSAVKLTDVEVNDPDQRDKRTFIDEYGNELSQKVNFFRGSIIFGAGIQYNVFGNTMLIAGIRYDNALNNFTDEPTWKTRMNFLAVNLGVLF